MKTKSEIKADIEHLEDKVKEIISDCMEHDDVDVLRLNTCKTNILHTISVLIWILNIKERE